MSIIINPNAPTPRRDGKSALDQVLNTMRIISQYRQSFFDLEAIKQDDGVAEPLTATQILKVCDVQQELMRDMVSFILYGEQKHDATNQDRKPSAADFKDDAPKLTQTAQG